MKIKNPYGTQIIGVSVIPVMILAMPTQGCLPRAFSLPLHWTLGRGSKFPILLLEQNLQLVIIIQLFRLFINISMNIGPLACLRSDLLLSHSSTPHCSFSFGTNNTHTLRFITFCCHCLFVTCIYCNLMNMLTIQCNL